MRNHFFFCWAASAPLLLTPFAHAESPAQIHQEAVAELVRQAWDTHPEVAAIEASIESLDHGIPQAGAWPDAILAAEYSNMPILRPWPGNHVMSGVQLKIAQKIPFLTKLGAREASAIARRDALLPMKDEKRNEISGQVRQLLTRWQMTRALRKVTVGHLNAVARFLKVVRIKYEIGRVEQHDLLRLEVLERKLKDDLVELENQGTRILSTLNVVLRRDEGEALRIIENVYIPFSPTKNLDEMIEEAKQNRPLLQMLQARAQAEHISADGQRTEKWPDLTIWAGYRIRLATGSDPGDNFVTLGFSVPIPWSSAGAKWEEKALAHEANAKSALATADGILLSLKGKLSSLQIQHNRALQRIQVYQKELIPAADKTLEAAFASYQVDRAGFAELFSAELASLEFERVVVRAQVEATLAAISIDTLTGRYAAQLQGSTP